MVNKITMMITLYAVIVIIGCALMGAKSVKGLANKLICVGVWL